MGEYKLSKAKASFLIETEPTAELYYLRGISSYFLGEHKKAKSDLEDALYRSNSEINPGLKDEIEECISAVEHSIEIKKEERNRKWEEIAGTVLQAGAQVFSAYQQTDETKLDSKQQFKSEAVSSEDYQRIKSVDLYYRDGDKARKMMSADLCKKGAYLYIKIGNKYYPRTTSNWQRYRNAIAYGHQQLYYND